MKPLTETKLYWVDENQNKWTKLIYTKEQAVKFSESLAYCDNCSNCINCINCDNCIDFKSNPEIITSKKIGSRNSQSTYYWNEEHEQVVCGCFKGTLEEFENKVKEVHKDNQHAKDYLNWIEKIKQYKSN